MNFPQEASWLKMDKHKRLPCIMLEGLNSYFHRNSFSVLFLPEQQRNPKSFYDQVLNTCHICQDLMAISHLHE